MKTLMNNLTINSLEVLEYTSEKADKLLFLQHGIYGHKEKTMNMLGVSLVKLGYTVVAIDAYKHGSRSEEPFASKNEDLSTLETMPVVKQTALDIRSIYQSHYEKDYPTFDFIGISMGGLIAYFLSTITSQIDQLVALISSPAFVKAAEYTFPKELQDKYPESEEARKLTESMDPSLDPSVMTYNRLIMLNGEDDDVIPTEQSETFYKENASKNIVFKTYKTDHKIIPKMHEDLLELLRNK